LKLLYSGVSKRTKRSGKFVWVARLIFLDDGVRREKTREARTKSEAKELERELSKKFERSGGREIQAERLSFAQLSTFYEKHYLKPAEYHDGRKIAGLRSYKTPLKQLERLRNAFGPRIISRLTAVDILSYKNSRLNDFSKQTKRPLSIATVNRELSLLRRILNVAFSEGWIPRNPFPLNLISLADEKKRERILTVEEEERLLLACDTHPGRNHLKAIIILALDSGMRKGEILKLTWTDINMEARTIQIRAYNTKTMCARTIYMTSRFHLELMKLRKEGLRSSGPFTMSSSEERVFGIRDNVKRSFGTARYEAGLCDVRFHDLRHTAATRLIRSGISIAEVGRILGHTQPSTTYRYVNSDLNTAQKAAGAFEKYFEEPSFHPTLMKIH
jgi:integrase